MFKKTLVGLGLMVAAGLALTACQDTKAREENEQLKAHVLQLQKDTGELGNRIDVLTKENTDLKAEIERMKNKHPAKKSATPKHHRTKSTTPASN